MAIGFKKKFIIFMLLLITGNSTILGVFFYNQQKQNLINSIDKKLESIVNTANYSLEGYHDKIENKSSVSNEEYEAIVKRWDDMVRNFDLMYVWSMMKINDQIVVTTGTEENVSKEEAFKFFQIPDKELGDESLKAIENKGKYVERSKTIYAELYIVSIPFKDSKGRDYTVNASMDLKVVNKDLQNLLNLTIIIVIIISIISILITYFFATIIVKKILAIVDYAEVIASGDFTNDVSENLLKSKDEIGVLSKSIQIIKDNLVKIIVQITDTSQDLISSSEELTATSQQATIAADEVSKTIEEIANSTNSQARDTEKAAIDITELGKLIEDDQNKLNELNEYIKQVIHLKEEGIKTIQESVKKTKVTQKTTEEINDLIINISENADNIYQSSEMIKSIADQTNLLALNASIEASRAGEAGRGFSVVADEIRKLAEQSDEFAQEISNVINELKYKIQNAVTTIQGMDKIISEQTQSVQSTENTFEDIAEAIEQSTNAIYMLNESGKIM